MEFNVNTKGIPYLPNQPVRNRRTNRPGRLFDIAVGIIKIVKMKKVPI